MAVKKNYYAVKKGRNTGIYKSWNDCKEQVQGFSGAVYKGFETLKEAEEFLEGEVSREIKDLSGMETFPETYAFVDGSYNIRTGTYGYGGFLVHKKERYVISGAGDDPEMASMRNVAGEIGGCTAALKKCIELGIEEVTVYYDYAGIENWATGDWKTNKKGTAEYKKYFDSIRDRLKVHFAKVRSHTGIPGNEEADRIAKKAVGL